MGAGDLLGEDRHNVAMDHLKIEKGKSFFQGLP
jgi:hypothetical protein